MINLEKRAKALLLLAVLFTGGLGLLGFNLVTNAKSWVVHPGNKNIYTNGILTGIGEITDINGKMLSQTVEGERKFAGDLNVRKATVHIVGDLDGFVSTGLHTTYRSTLAGFNFLNGIYGNGNNITTTIDSDICVEALNALGSSSGAVVIMNYKTGDILCSVSSPTFDPQNPPDVDKETQKKTGLYVNRVFSGFMAPGSIFKLVTAAAAIDNIDDIFDAKFKCGKGNEIDGEVLTCHSNHGTINFKKALIESCNSSFSQIALMLGQDTLKKYTKKLGFNDRYSVNGIKLSSSLYPFEDMRNIDFGWSAIGQHHDMVNPLHFTRFVAAIANEGVAPEPSVIDSIKTQNGFPVIFSKGFGKTMLSKETANILKDYMRATVIENYKETRFKDMNLCAKSGTAEIEKSDKPHSWFVGFMDREDYPYAFAVVVENGGAGADSAANITGKVLKKVIG